MASQLRDVLNRFTNQRMPVSINQMAREMQLEPGVLHGMIDYWVRKGKLRAVSTSSAGCVSCGVKGACPFVVAMPTYYEMVAEGENTASEAEPPCSCGGKCGV